MAYAARGEVDEQMAYELDGYIQSEGDLYKTMYLPIVKNLVNKMAQKKYSSELAVKAFMHLVEAGAKKFHKEFHYNVPWNIMANKATREDVAKSIRDHFEVEAKLGNWDHLLTKVSARAKSSANRSGSTHERTCEKYRAKERGWNPADFKCTCGASRNRSGGDRLFVGTYPTGIVYSDRSREEHGDYKRLAFLPYDTLKLEWRGRVPADLKAQITKHAAGIQARSGQEYNISASGQTVRLGSRNRSGKTKPRPLGTDRDRFHGNPNARKNRSGPTAAVRTWADGHGRWHAEIHSNMIESASRSVARKAITAEIKARNPSDVVRGVVLISENGHKRIYAET